MAGRGNPSFLKNQKAKKRQEKAAEKRAARQARNAEKAAARAAGESGVDAPELLESEEPGAVDGEDTTPDQEV
jgi:hypothetical protein